MTPARRWQAFTIGHSADRQFSRAHGTPDAKIDKTSDDLTALAHSLRIQTDDLQNAANEITSRVRVQASRLDAVMSDLLDGVDRASNFMADAVAKPMRQVSAVIASVRGRCGIIALCGARSPFTSGQTRPAKSFLFV